MKGIVWVDESNDKPPICKKRKRRVGKRKLEFIEWGSRPLFDFLEAIGEDAQKKHSRQEVAVFISKYINDKGLASAQKKKRVLCDERLFALFGKKSIPRIKVYDLLEEHFTENHGDSDDEELDSSEDEYCGEKNSKSNHTGQMKKVPESRKSCFAAVIHENMKLVYLKRSLIQELLKVPASYECKIVGSFVRMKSDPNDIYQKNRFQLQLVTGVEKVSGDGDAGNEVHLKVSNFFKDVPVSMLSDDNFSEEEIEDVRERIKAGLLKRLTVNELELKAQMLHVDITKHWIAKEISLLQKKIDHANEKGWRKELFEYLDRRKMLQTASEVEKLLLKPPAVIAEELEPEGTVTLPSEKAEGSGCSPTSILQGDSNRSSTDVTGSGDFVTPPSVIFNDAHTLEVQNEDGAVPNNNANGSGDFVTPPSVVFNDAHTLEVQNEVMDGVVPNNNANGSGEFETSSSVIYNDEQVLEVQNGGIDSINPSNNLNEAQPVDFIIQQRMQFANVNYDGSSRKEMPDLSFTETGPQETPEKPVGPTLVIELSDDELEDEDPKSKYQSGGENLDPDDVIWYYLDPQGKKRGPFSLYSLKRWYDADYFHPGFMVWQNGQTSGGIILVDILRRIFPH